MRYVSAQLLRLLEDDLWRETAGHANAMAQRLAAAAAGVPGVRVAYPVQANAVFVALPAAVTERLLEEYRFYTWDEQAGVVRWMCSWQTTADDVDRLVAALRRSRRLGMTADGGAAAYASIDELAAAFGLEEAQAAALSRYADLMLAWRRGNVTALRTREEIVSTLFGDALALLDVPQLRERERRRLARSGRRRRRPRHPPGRGAARRRADVARLGGQEVRLSGGGARGERAGRARRRSLRAQRASRRRRAAGPRGVRGSTGQSRGAPAGARGAGGPPARARRRAAGQQDRAGGAGRGARRRGRGEALRPRPRTRRPAAALASRRRRVRRLP